MKRIFLKYFIYIAAFLLGEWLLKGVTIEDYLMVLVFGLLMLLINMTLKPILLIIGIPLNMITFGLFTLIINSWMVQIVDAMMASITIEGFLPGLFIGTVIVVLYFMIVPKYDKSLKEKGEA